MFVEIDDVESWYLTALDGLRYLSTALGKRDLPMITELTHDEIIGMTAAQWKEFLADRESEHEMFASLALLASFEGCIRRDAKKRGETDTARHHQKFKRIKDERHVKISKIFDIWESLLKNTPQKKHLTILRDLYSDRNVIAHGNARRGQFPFEIIRKKLHLAYSKWRDSVSDFDRLS